MKEEIESIKNYALENNVPIMQDDGINYLTNYIKKNKIKKILEIGTAIGYSAIMMCLVDNDIEVTTIERDEKRYLEAIKNVKKFKLEDRINLIYNDALEVKINEIYDLIFIDAAKSQYIKFFEKFKKNLNPRGFIITDNINFHGLVMSDKSLMSRNLRQLITKLEKYITFLNTNEEFKTRFFEVGDGVAISRRKKSKDE